MQRIDRDSLAHMVDCAVRLISIRCDSAWARLSARWWGVPLGRGCAFVGRPRFRRHPGSRMEIGPYCRFLSSPASNRIGVNRPCMLTTLKKGAQLTVGQGCGFNGTAIACAQRIVIGCNVRCGANTLINDTDWHPDDPRSGPDAPVVIGDNVWLGVNITVLKGVTIGEGTLVGAGSLVTKSLPAGVLAAGVPAKVIRAIGRTV